MKSLIFIFLLVSLGGCLADDRGCYYNEGEESCDERSGDVVVRVGVLQCQSTQATLDQSSMAIAQSGIGLLKSFCADLDIPVEDGSSECENNIYYGVDVIEIYDINYQDAIDVERVEDIKPFAYSLKDCE